MVEILQALKDGKDVPVGSQTGRKGSMAAGGTTTLVEKARKSGVS
jgi:NADH dehydrogenase (ubiquinone) flavoprotein 2